MGNEIDLDLDAVIDDGANKSPEYRLWLTVTLIAVNDLLSRRSSAESFLFDNKNEFFNHVADELGYDPDVLREGIRKALEKQKQRVRMPYNQ